MLNTAEFFKYFIDEKGIAESLMTTLQTPRILWAKLVTPQTNRFITYDNAARSQQIFDVPVAQVEPIIDPDGLLNDFGRKSMTFVLIIGRTHYAIVSQRPLICQYHIETVSPVFLPILGLSSLVGLFLMSYILSMECFSAYRVNTL